MERIETVQFGDQVWMADNYLSVAFEWNKAKRIQLEGWRLPTVEDFFVLQNRLISISHPYLSDEGKELKLIWNDGNEYQEPGEFYSVQVDRMRLWSANPDENDKKYAHAFLIERWHSVDRGEGGSISIQPVPINERLHVRLIKLG